MLMMGRTNIVKMSIIPKAIYRFSAIPIKIQMAVFTEIDCTILKFVGNRKVPQIIKAILRKKNIYSGSIMLPDFKLYYKATVIKTVWYSHTSRLISVKRNRELQNKLTHIYGEFIYDEGAKNT